MTEVGLGATHSLVLEDGGEVADDVDDAEDDAVLGAHGEVGALGVARDGLLGGGLGEEGVHRAERADLLARGVDGEDEHEDDGEKDRGVRAEDACKIGGGREGRLKKLTSHKGALHACHQQRRRQRHRAG